MFSINTRIDSNGFWYLIEVGQEASYSFSYFALGSQNKFCSGEIEGHTAHSQGWQFCGVSFPILHLGITSFNVEEAAAAEVAEQPAADVQTLAAVDISRRRMINQTVSTLLVGGAFVSSLMGASPSAHAAPARQQTSPYHSPYYNPYHPPRR
ncbi:MAG: hypothetical protein JOZ96_26170 [Acidobacteria bacterium]|nr:hypothetical protein [Acidobacteriota bacterium]